MRTRLAATSVLAGSVLLMLLLSGCSGGQPAGTGGTKTALPAPTPTPTATAPQDVLFTITANVRGRDGATIGIVMTAHEPVPYSKTEAKPLIAEFVKACGVGVGGVAITPETLAANGAILMKIDISSNAHDKPFISPLDLLLGSPYFGQAVSGKGVTIVDSKNPCWGGYSWTTSGALSVIGDFESGIPGPDLGAWRYAMYGFSVAFGSNATIEACKVTLTERATKADLSTVDGWDPSDAASGTTCAIGYAGE